MESLKPLLLLAVLGGVGYGVYVALNKQQPQVELEEAPAWGGAPQVELGASTDSPRPRTLSADTARRGRREPAQAQPKSVAPDAFSGNQTSTRGLAAAPVFDAPSDSATVQPAASIKPVENAPGAVEPPSTRSSDSTVGDRYGNFASPAELAGRDAVGAAPPAESAQPPAGLSSDRFEYESAMRTARTYLAQNKLADALRELTPWYAHPVLSPDEQAELTQLLGQLAGTVVYSREHWTENPHVVREGETLESIAERYEIPAQLLAKINGVKDPSSLRPGVELKVVRGPFDAELTHDQKWLTLYVDGLYAGRFQVLAGRTVGGTEGKLPVAKVPADHPTNAVHCRYISLGGNLLVIDTDGIERGTVPPPGDAGWLRLDPRDMDDVFHILSDRSQATIRR